MCRLPLITPPKVEAKEKQEEKKFFVGKTCCAEGKFCVHFNFINILQRSGGERAQMIFKISRV